MRKPRQHPRNIRRIVLGISIGSVIGTALGVQLSRLTGDIALWLTVCIAFGINTGLAIAVWINQQASQATPDDTSPPTDDDAG